MLEILIALALIFAFLNGYRDSSSIIAGVIASRAMPPQLALILVAAAEFSAPFLFGAAVARTMATGLVDPAAISLTAVVIALLAAVVWILFAWLRGIPASSSHALVGGILGSVLLIHGPHALIASGLFKVVLPLFLAPPIGLLVGYLAMRVLLLVFQNATPRINVVFRRLQVFTMLVLALSHGANDAQKSIGVIVLGLVLAGRLAVFEASPLVIGLSAAAIALGASRGDQRLIRTLVGKIYRIRPVNALASQGASSLVILSSSLLGAPVSTSQVISMALMGSGAAERVNKVRWQVGVEMLATWALTIPATMALAAIIFALGTRLPVLGGLLNQFINCLGNC